PVHFTDDYSGLTGCNGTGQFIRTWLVEPNCLSAPAYTQVITVVDQATPTIVVQDVQLDFSASSQVILTPAQVGGGTTDNGGPVALSLSQSTFVCADFIETHAYPVTLTATDMCGNSATAEAIVSGVGELLALG